MRISTLSLTLRISEDTQPNLPIDPESPAPQEHARGDGSRAVRLCISPAWEGVCPRYNAWGAPRHPRVGLGGADRLQDHWQHAGQNTRPLHTALT